MKPYLVRLGLRGAVAFIAGFSLTLVSTATVREAQTRTAQQPPIMPIRTFEESKQLIDRSRRIGPGEELGASSLTPVDPERKRDEERPRWEIERRDAHKFFEEFLGRRGKTRFFLKMFGPHAVRALGTPTVVSDAWRRATAPREDFMMEPNISVLRRLSAINVAAPLPVVPASFQVIAYAFGDNMEAIVGQDLGTGSLDREQHMQGLVSMLGYRTDEIPPTVRNELLEAVDKFEEDRVRLRFRFWRAVGPVVRKKIETSMYERDVVGLYVVGGRLHVIRRGESRALDRATAELARARDEEYRTIRSLLR